MSLSEAAKEFESAKTAAEPGERPGSDEFGNKTRGEQA